MAHFAGKWKLVKTEHFDEYMRALGVGFVLRTLGNNTKPSQHISVDGDNVEIKTLSNVKNSQLNFGLGKQFEETTLDGRKVQTTFTVEDDKLVQRQKGTPESTLIREIIDDNTMVMTLECKDVKAVRTYNRE